MSLGPVKLSQDQYFLTRKGQYEVLNVILHDSFVQFQLIHISCSVKYIY